MAIATALMLSLALAQGDLASVTEGLEETLRRSAPGRALLSSLPGGEDRSVRSASLLLLLSELEQEVGSVTSEIVDISDPQLEEAMLELRRVPRDLRQQPVVALMVLLDEWIARLDLQRAAGFDRRPPLVERLRASSRVDREDLEGWLETTFPVMFECATRIGSRAGLAFGER